MIKITSSETLDSIALRLANLSYDKLAKLIYPSPRYKTFSIAKKSGGIRVISAPRIKIKIIQWELLKLIQEYYPDIKQPVHGFVKDRSIVTNAEQHLNKTFIFNIDLEDFFPSIHFGRVRGIFRNKPFEFSDDVAAVLAHICCKGGKLPQGAPTSPAISNLACRQLDNDLRALAKEYRATYTRYCDDITFSFTVRKIQDLPKQIINTKTSPISLGAGLEAIIHKSSFKINHEKTRLNGHSSRMEVTGITINEQPNVTRKYVHEIRGMVHSWEKYGLIKAEEHLGMKYKKQLRSGSTPPFHNVLRGKLLFLKMVRGESSPVYSKLANQFNTLVNKEKLPEKSKLPISRKVANDIDVERATFVIRCEQDMPDIGPVNQQGSAFIYAEKYLVTCYHVISHYLGGKYHEIHEDHITLTDYQNKKLKVAVVAKCSGRDVAILEPKFDISDYPFFSRAENLPNLEELLQVIGFPNHGYGKKISRINTQLTVAQYPKHGVQYIDVRDTIRQGNSGGPVINKNREIVGIAVEGADQESGDNGIVVVSEIDAVIAMV
jgi:RNA-directed DNA polymerase